MAPKRRFTILISDNLGYRVDKELRARGSSSRQRSIVFEDALDLYFRHADGDAQPKHPLDALLATVEPDTTAELTLATLRERLFMTDHKVSTQALRMDLITRGWRVDRNSRGMPYIEARFTQEPAPETPEQPEAEAAPTPEPAQPEPAAPPPALPDACPRCLKSQPWKDARGATECKLCGLPSSQANLYHNGHRI